MAQLFLKPQGWQGRTVALNGEEISIGRHPANTIRVRDDRASRKHCVIGPGPGGLFYVRDLGSRNGTRVNGVTITESALRAGDILRVGKHEFEVIAREVEAPASPSGEPAQRKRGAEPEPPWARELRELIEDLPPKGDVETEVGVIDASGHTTDALKGDSPGPRAVRLLLQCASKARATDIHLEPRSERYGVRMRVDGQMIPIIEVPASVGELVAGLIKTACEMETAGRRAMLDGTFSATIGRAGDKPRRIEFRVSFTPAVHGQKMVCRVLDSLGAPDSLDHLGLAPYMLPSVRRVVEQDHGMILACGPTGSGKTTTLYNCLREIDREAKNVVTIEDPVEYKLEGVTQIPIADKQGAGFGDVLRSVLRQDPDVIFVGEIRDEQTARTAMQAAMTGHLVFSTVHAKDTMAAVFRLLDLGVEPYLVANALDLVLAQRLVRVLCDNCKTPVALTPGQSSKIGRYLSAGAGGPRPVVYASTGCARCLRTGYRGRRAIFELLEFNDDLRDIVLGTPSIQEMRRIAEQGVFTTLAQFGYRLAGEGVTTLDEVERVAG
ncbi:MAG: ATPase, T2SS/T4P/T4SS family [Phycisphaerales bacterium JB039]